MQYASYQQTNHYAVVGDMTIRFYLILLKRNRVFSELVIVFLMPPSCSKRMASYPELVIDASYALLLLNAYVALFRSWHVFIPKHFFKCRLIMMPKGRGRNGLPIRREQIEKG